VEFEGQPRPAITWMLNGKELKQGNSVSIDSTRTSARLMIIHCSSEHRGQYECKGKNKLGETVSATAIIVNGLFSL